MDIKIEIRNLGELIAAFQKAPESVQQNMRLALRVCLRNVKRRAQMEHRFRSRSGALEWSIKDEVIQDWPPKGRIYLDPTQTMTKSGVSYGVFQHEGTDDEGSGRHFVKPVDKKALRWSVPGGFQFSRGHWVSGIKPDPFIYNAGENERANINAVFEQYTERALREAGIN